MTTLHHPTIAGITVEVDAKAVKAWEAQGWLTEAPEPAESDDAGE